MGPFVEQSTAWSTQQEYNIFHGMIKGSGVSIGRKQLYWEDLFTSRRVSYTTS